MKLSCALAGLLACFVGSHARADILTEIGGDTRNFVVLYDGFGSNQLHISSGLTNINGNIGIGSTGSLKATGSGTLTGEVYFSAPNTGQCSAQGFNYNCASSLYGQSDVTNDLSYITNFSSSIAAETGTPISLNVSSGQILTINASTGLLDSHGNRVFSVTSLNLGSGSSVVINGDSAGDNVVFNIATCPSQTCNFDGNMTLNGITADQVMFNIRGNNELKVDGANVGGVFVDPNGQIFVSASTVTGALYGGGENPLTLVSGVTVNAGTPEPAAFVLAGTVLLGIMPVLRRKLRRPRRD
jgi:hypothetical protein